MPKQYNNIWAIGLVVAIATFAVPLFAGSQDTTETRALTGFTEVRLAGSSNLTLNEGEDFNVKVTGPAAFMDKAKAKVRNGTLEMSVESENWFKDYNADDFHFFVTMPHIAGVHLAGSGNISVGPLDTKNLSVSLTGSGDIEFKGVIAKELDLALTGSGDIKIDKVEAIESSALISGSGDIDIGGEVQRQAIKIMGSGGFNGRGLNAESASGAIMGSGDVEMGKVKQHSIRVMGSGNVRVGN